MTDQDQAKVLYTTFEHIPAPTGTACWSTEIIKTLGQHFSTDSLSLKSEDLSHIERFHRARLLRVPTGPGAFLEGVKAYQRALNRQLDSEEYACCQFTSIWEGMVLTSRSKELDYKLIYEVNSLPSIDFRASHPDQAQQVETSHSLKQQEELCFSRADKLIASSPLIREHLIKRGVPAKKIALVTPSVSLEPFDAAPDRPGQAGTILYLGSLRPWQGVTSLLQALTELPRHQRVKLLLVVSRDDPGFNEVQGKIQMLGLVRSVELVDPVGFQELPGIISQASVCVAPLASHEHNWRAAALPHKVLTYMAGRRPIVAAEQPVLRGLLENGRTGLHYQPGDTQGLLEALTRLLLDRELASQLGNQARLQLEEHYGLEASQTALMAVYGQLLGQASGLAAPSAGLDTQPSLVTADPAAGFSAEPETRPVPPSSQPKAPPTPAPPETAKVKLEAVAGQPATDEPPTDPTRPASDDGEADVVFSSVEDEDTAPRPSPPDADAWQVQEASDVQLATVEATMPRAPGAGSTAGERPHQTARRRRYLLGGPAISSETTEAENRPVETVPSGKPLQTDEELSLLPEDEVELVDPADTPPGVRTGKPPGNEDR